MFSDNSLSKAEWQDIFWFVTVNYCHNIIFKKKFYLHLFNRNVHILCIWNFNSAIALQEKLVEIFTAYITKEQEVNYSFLN